MDILGDTRIDWLKYRWYFILISVIIMRWVGVGSNIMSLGGIAIAIGAMVDGAIVMIENMHKHLERAGPGADRW